MASLRLGPGKAQTNPLSYGGTPIKTFLLKNAIALL